ncbi:MAG: hypothetical protein HYX69_21075 [Planctomycetia bacterium]|nr:hypothetical protein [Planctomycetia bacterium]
MNHASQLSRGSTLWSSASTRTQLYWVLIVSAVLFVGVRVTSFVTSHSGRAAAPSEEAIAAVAAEPNQPAPAAEAAPAESTAVALGGGHPARLQESADRAATQNAAEGGQLAAEGGQDPRPPVAAIPQGPRETVAPTDNPPADPDGTAPVADAADEEEARPRGLEDLLRAFATSSRRRLSTPSGYADQPESAPQDEAQPAAPSPEEWADDILLFPVVAPAAAPAGQRAIDAVVRLFTSPGRVNPAQRGQQSDSHEPGEAVIETDALIVPPDATTPQTSGDESAHETGPAITPAGDTPETPPPAEAPGEGAGEQEAADADATGSSQEPAVLPGPSVLVLVNPHDNGATIRYLINGHAFSMAPGQSHRLPVGKTWRLRFHRGGEFGEFSEALREGSFEFRITDEGWQLAPREGDTLVEPSDAR